MNDLMRLFMPGDGRLRSIFFAGKGGVGKTSISCAVATKLADEGYRTLLLTTDPASHLGEVFEQEIGNHLTSIKGVENLWATRIDQQEVVIAYKERILGEARSKYSDDVLAMMEEQLDSPCTEEMAAFDKFIEYASSSDFQIIVFDTAPTGHTLRLLELPVDWTRQLELQAGGTIIAEDLNRQARERFGKVIDRMRSVEETVFSFVVYPEHIPIVEAWRAAEELKGIGVPARLIVANFILPPERCNTAFFQKRLEMQRTNLKDLGEKFGAPVAQMPLLDGEIVGLSKLREAAAILFDRELSG
jgi:arsenite-transporting ATPase